MSSPLWWVTKDGDVECLALYERHYPARQYRDGRIRKEFVGPGQKLVLRTEHGDALFVWRNFFDWSIDGRTGLPQAGVQCAIFRNESEHRSSALIQQADAIADHVWPNCRHYTYIDPARLASALAGACFLFAGWRYVRIGGHRARTVQNQLLIIERPASAR